MPPRGRAVVRLERLARVLKLAFGSEAAAGQRIVTGWCSSASPVDQPRHRDMSLTGTARVPGRLRHPYSFRPESSIRIL